jgi:uncharacterized protein (DUF433 family)
MMEDKEVVMESVILNNKRIAGTRISVYDVYYYLVDDWKPAEIAQLLRLSVEQVQAAIQYIQEHRAEVMAVHQEIEDRNARGNPPEIEAKLEASHARFQALVKDRRRGKQEAGLLANSTTVGPGGISRLFR